MDSKHHLDNLSYSVLKKRHREVRDTIPENLSLRIHRALSWLRCAEQQPENKDAEFIFLWVSFNAAYSHEIEDRRLFKEKKGLLNFLKILIHADSENMIYHIVWKEFSKSIRLLLSNKYVFQKFWDYQNQKITERDWLKSFEISNVSVNKALGKMDTIKVLAIVFDRLYTLRNQLIHGGATWDSSVNREQIRDGSNILRLLVPSMIYIMINNNLGIVGQPCYPVVR